MAFSVSGISASSVLLNYENAQNRLQQDDAALASGVNSTESDPAGSSIAALLQTNADSATQAASNDSEELGALNVAAGADQGTASILQQLNTLAVQASNGLLTPDQLADISTQAGQLVQQIDTNATQTEFNGASLAVPDAAQLGVANLDFSTAAGAADALTSVQNAISQLGSQQAQLGAQQASLNDDLDNENTLATNLQASESSIADTNVPQTATDANQAGVQSQVDLSVIAAIDKENAALAGIYINSLA